MGYSIHKVIMNKEISLDPGNPYYYKYKNLALAKMNARFVYNAEDKQFLNRVIIRDSDTNSIVFKIDKSGER